MGQGASYVNMKDVPMDEGGYALPISDPRFRVDLGTKSVERLAQNEQI